MIVLLVLKALIGFLRKFTSNEGTALPGLILEKYFPKSLKKLFSQFETIILVTGTNGKTTTSRMLTYLLQQNGISCITNSSGSNLIRGIASEVLDRVSFRGKLNATIAVFEVEEATMPRLVNLLKPDIIIVTNIFRDQLDAYGEIDKTLEYISEAIIRSSNPVLVLNDDDVRVSALKTRTTNNVYGISFDAEYLPFMKLENNQVIKDTKRNTGLFTITDIKISDTLETTFNLSQDKKPFLENIVLRAPGYHNTFNASAAIITLCYIGKFSPREKNSTLQLNPNSHLAFTTIDLTSFPSAFGRGEIIHAGATSFQILLAKNPAGFNLNISLLQNVKKQVTLFLILNDKIADGKDISWIWDCDLELLKQLQINEIHVSGTRKYDLALRLIYEGLPVTKIHFSVQEGIEYFVSRKIDFVYSLPTYTGMLELRKELSRYTKVKKMWQQ